MKFEYRYYGASTVSNSASSTEMRFAPDTLRAPTHFVAQLNKHIPFREAICALHDVVVADQRYQPPDKTAYLAWRAQNEDPALAELIDRNADLRARMAPLSEELKALRAQKSIILKPFAAAQAKYFDYIYKANFDAWVVLDPVITVHPDRVFFECFSRDESSYASLSCSHNVFDRVDDFACGTTNVDYSEGLYGEFQKIRDYKATRLAIDPSGFQVATAGDPSFKEEKIDVPETWVRGFLQVSSAMNLPARRLDLHPMDVHNFCHLLRRKKERVGPRSIRFVLTPGEPIRALFEPWNDELVCRRSIYQGNAAEEIRIWGRRRLMLLERLIPVAHSFTVHLMGSGMPSFWIANLPDMQLTLGLSGWTANDWARAGQFDLLAPRGAVDDNSKTRVFAALGQRWFATADQLAADTGLTRAIVESALTLYTQAGRVIYDLTQGVYRLRELSREPLPLDVLRFASAIEEKAATLLAVQSLSEQASEAQPDGGLRLRARSKENGRPYQVMLRLDADRRIVDGSCECNHFTQNRMHKGPCVHMLVLRMDQARRDAAPGV
ncbi:SWIM zinc finger family protein [Massilia pseudoviolaceinigra]|uniref:SWIM zinc finger family protein n=1 Tax=Massilia pseudoviolaceinigra TaxID=3057165 RepID=UPI002796C8FB|nr:SWIM zinc finger family protein [Massilia sp. CCM 9206]MDQ1925037.1 SWIM zinc finger family protein [Massilia sp. CCM 9206]